MLIPFGIHVLVADGARWTLFRNVGPLNAPSLDLVDGDEQHVERTSAMGADSPGRSFQSMSHRSPSYEVIDHHQADEDRFAIRAADRLERALIGGQERAILIAPPHVLSVIRDRLSPSARSRLIATIDKDYTSETASRIAELLDSYGS